MADVGSPQPPPGDGSIEAGLPPGWMSAPELAWLASAASTHKVVVEVGCWQGRTTKVLAAATDGLVWAVDNWAGEGSINATEPDYLESWFREHLEDEIAAGKVGVLCMESVAAASLLREAQVPIDMIFIDADHRYPAPLHDVYAWHACLRPGGLLCGHDRWLEGVDQSLAELRLPWTETGAGSIWRLT
jgi:hypothetical protein